MIKVTKRLSILLVFITIFSLHAFYAYANDSEAEQQEHLFSVTDAEGAVKYYDEKMDLVEIAPTLTDGDTVTLLSNIVYDTSITVESVLYFAAPEESEEVITIYFDFNGYYINQQRKHTAENLEVQMNSFFFNCGYNTTLYLYSSKPGAAFYGKDLTNPSSPHRCPNFARTLHSTATLYIGDYGDYSGNNLSVYTAVVAQSASGNVYINGGYYYRMLGDSRAQFILHDPADPLNPLSQGYMEINDAVICSRSGALFTFTAMPTEEEREDFSIVVNNCTVIGSGSLVYELPLGYSLKLNDTSVFCSNIIAECTGSDRTTNGVYGKIYLNYGCVFAEQYTALPEYVALPEDYEYASVDKSFNSTLYYPDWSSNYDTITYDPVAHEVSYAGAFQLADPEDVVTLTWICDNNTKVQKVLKGTVPNHPFTNIADSDAVKYEAEGYGPLTEDTTWILMPKRSFDIYVNLTVYSSINVNYYIPVSMMEYIKEVNLTGVSELNTSKATICKIDGVDYYKFSTSGLRLSNCIKDYSYMLVAKDGKNNERILTGNFSFTGYMKQILQGEFDSDTKAFITSTVNRIINAYNLLEVNVPEEFKSLINPTVYIVPCADDLKRALA